jgi:divalent metal cation (Fe/Co/Zn/Cd) transporter
VEGVRGIEKVFARKSGVRFWVDMHVEVDPDMSVRDAHAIAHRVKDAVRNALPNVADVLVHIEPHECDAAPAPDS